LKKFLLKSTLLLVTFFILFILPKTTYAKITIYDSNNNKIIFTTPPDKIIVTSPEVQEILYALNVHKKIIANIVYCDYPEKLKKLPKVGDFLHPNIEKIVKLNPDLVILTDYTQKDAINTLSRLGIKIMVVYINSLSQLYDFIYKFGIIFNKEKKAKKIIAQIKSKLKKNITHIKEKPKIFPILWDKPIRTAADMTLLNEVIEKAEGINISKKIGKGYLTINEEFLIKNKPDYILLCDKNINVKQSLKKLFLKYPDIKIIDTINPNLILRASPRIIQGIIILNKIITKK